MLRLPNAAVDAREALFDEAAGRNGGVCTLSGGEIGTRTPGVNAEVEAIGSLSNTGSKSATVA
jgi:hypothetical protein